MGKNDRLGRRKSRRENRKTRKQELGYYLIVTDTEATEKNYLLGLRNSLPLAIQHNIVFKVVKADTRNLVEKCMEEAANYPQFSQWWIVFDRDEVKNFDEIIQRAQQYDIHVGWSNPCIEIWFYAYFGCMPNIDGSVQCCNGFAKVFKQYLGSEYHKSDEKIYDKLRKYGDENQALAIAKQKRQECCNNGKNVL